MKTIISLNENKEKRKSKEKKQNSLVDEVKLLLEDNASKEREFMTTIGFDHHIRKVDAYKSDKIITEQEEAKYGDIYKLEDIKKICLDYDLRFLPIEYYKGNITADLPSVLMRFCEEHNIPQNYHLRYDLYIAAPKENFELQERPKDPLLFYRTRDENFTLVHKWGKDFTVMRLLKGFLNRNDHTAFISRFLIIALICFSVQSFIGLFSNWWIILDVVIGCIVGGIIMPDEKNDKNWDSKYLN